MPETVNKVLFQWIHAGAGSHPVRDGLAVLFGEGGPYMLAVLFVVLWFVVDEGRKTALLEATEAAVVGLLINEVIGVFYFHPRPYMIGLCTPLIPHGPETSFPSDHGTLLFAAACHLLLVRRWISCGAVLSGIALLTAWGRVYSGIHFPMDMAGSLVVAVGSVVLLGFAAGTLLPLNEKVIRVAGRVFGRFGRYGTRGQEGH
ncbi:MAG: undecaprenyl-diphosphatase [Desulfobulbaceae bacterium]